MDVAEGRVVEVLQHIRRHLVYISDRYDLGICPIHLLRRGSRGKIKLVADEDIALRGIDVLPKDKPPQRLVVGQIIPLLVRSGNLLHHGRPHEGKKVKVYLPMVIREGYLLDVLPLPHRRHADHMDVLTLKKPPVQVHPGCAVMVSADHHNLRSGAGPGQHPQEIIKKFHRLRRRHGPVVDIPGNDDGVRLMLPGQGRNL